MCPIYRPVLSTNHSVTPFVIILMNLRMNVLNLIIEWLLVRRNNNKMYSHNKNNNILYALNTKQTNNNKTPNKQINHNLKITLKRLLKTYEKKQRKYKTCMHKKATTKEDNKSIVRKSWDCSDVMQKTLFFFFVSVDLFSPD